MNPPQHVQFLNVSTEEGNVFGCRKSYLMSLCSVLAVPLTTSDLRHITKCAWPVSSAAVLMTLENPVLASYSTCER